jgi:hypothetical protein
MHVYYAYLNLLFCDSRLHQLTGGGIKTARVYKEFMEYLILIKNVFRWISFFSPLINVYFPSLSCESYKLALARLLSVFLSFAFVQFEIV